MKKYISVGIKLIILVCCVLFMIYFAYKICNYLYEDKKSKELNNKLIDSAIIFNDIDDNNDTFLRDENLLNQPSVKVNFTELKQKNKEIVGWIYLEDSLINFPVVQTNNNDYYLRRLIDGSYNSAGSIFMDYRNDSDITDWNTIIYGHNMKNNTMFGTLLNYKEQSYYDQHKKMYYFTENKEYELELIAGYVENANANIYNATINEKEEVLEKAKRLSTFISNINEEENDKFMTLSTCSYEYDEARYVLIGRLKEIAE